MKNLSYEEQISVIAKALKEEIELLKSLPEEEAYQMAHRELVKWGIIDEDGNYTDPYKDYKELVDATNNIAEKHGIEIGIVIGIKEVANATNKSEAELIQKLREAGYSEEGFQHGN